MINLSGSELEAAKAWFHDVLVWGGFTDKPKRPLEPVDYKHMYGYYNSPYNKKYAKIVCKALELRPADYKFLVELDKALNELADESFVPRINAKNNSGAIKCSQEQLAKFLAYFCQKGKLYWDTLGKTTYEMDEIKNTVMGKVLWDAHLFTSQENEEEPAPQAQPKPRATSSGIPGQPKNDYKSQGAKSDQMIGLIGQPHEKIYLQGKILAISGFDANGNSLDVNATAFVRPLKSKYATVDGKKNRVLFGASKGYDDCRIYLPATDINVMTQIMQDLTSSANFQAPQNVASVKVVLKNSDANGYFKVATDLGEVYVSAKKMNENLEEEVLEEPARKESDLKNYKDPKYKLVVPNEIFTENFLND